MGLKKGDRVYELERLRLSNDKPLIYEVSYLPVVLCKGLDQYDFNQVSLYETLNQHYNIQITNAYENLVASKLSKKHAALLNGKENDSSMYIERLSYVGNAVIEYTQSITGSNKYKYTVKLM
ncbi:GntR family transcriptional regulator [Staphylococcus aureus]|nr:UTRA domain-containing protein [Staphylococcus aureus]UXT70623.1 UTRA domain-containing protein [Staphylococcus aureus]UXT94648.1 UTRA domain-containing protein [Staphylococcus aureus]UXU12953.1 UTRA domain-containing protein [Staphylococcus aureus]